MGGLVAGLMRGLMNQLIVGRMRDMMGDMMRKERSIRKKARGEKGNGDSEERQRSGMLGLGKNDVHSIRLRY